MDWLVSGMENCSHAKLPMYLLIIQIYWKDLLRLRKYGRRLVAALLSQYTAVWSLRIFWRVITIADPCLDTYTSRPGPSCATLLKTARTN